ncbi:MAG: MoxR family ATPase, partial [Emcibacter sp.]|nr:MoxR family ATPase [Emcibacter sp.]
QVTLDNMSHPLPEPFFVIATQNPAQQLGTFPLPEAQLDRFLMSVHIDYPSKAAEQLLYREGHKTTVLDKAIDFATVKYLQNKVGDVTVSDAIVGYVHDLVSFSRHNDKFPAGLSPRAGLALIEAAKAWAFLGGRDFVVPEDVQAVLSSVVRHRLQDQTTLGAALISDQGCIGQYLSDHVAVG